MLSSWQSNLAAPPGTYKLDFTISPNYLANLVNDISGQYGCPTTSGKMIRMGASLPCLTGAREAAHGAQPWVWLLCGALPGSSCQRPAGLLLSLPRGYARSESCRQTPPSPNSTSMSRGQLPDAQVLCALAANASAVQYRLAAAQDPLSHAQEAALLRCLHGVPAGQAGSRVAGGY